MIKIKTNLYKHNTKGDDVTLKSISREKIISMILCSIQNKSASPLLSLSMFLNFGHFSALCSYKKGLIKKSEFACYSKLEDWFWKNCFSAWASTLDTGLIIKGWYDMFVACGIWCLADFSSVSPSSEQPWAHQAKLINVRPACGQPTSV